MKERIRKGKVRYNTSVVNNIIILAVSEVEGIAPNTDLELENIKPENYLQKIRVDFDKDDIYVDLSVYVYEGVIIPDIAFNVQEAVKNAIENMTNYRAQQIDVRVLGILPQRINKFIQ